MEVIHFQSYEIPSDLKNKLFTDETGTLKISLKNTETGTVVDHVSNKC